MSRFPDKNTLRSVKSFAYAEFAAVSAYKSLARFA